MERSGSSSCGEVTEKFIWRGQGVIHMESSGSSSHGEVTE